MTFIKGMPNSITYAKPVAEPHTKPPGHNAPRAHIST